MIPSWYSIAERPNRGIFFVEQARALHRAGVDVGVVYAEYRSLRLFNLRSLNKSRFQIRYYDEDGIRTMRLHGWNLGRRFKPGAMLWVHQSNRLVDRYIERFGTPDLLHAQSVLWGGYAAMLAARTYDLPYVITEHSSVFGQDTVSNWQVPYVRDAWSKADLLLVVSRSLADVVQSYLENERQVDVVPNLVDTDFFNLPPKPRTNHPFTFLVVSRLEPVKGLSVLLTAFSRQWGGACEVRLVIAGDGSERAHLQSLAQELGIGRQVRFLGALSRASVRDAMWQANVLVLPSLYETFGVVLIEALSTGMPVLATRCGGPGDIVIPSVGWLAEPDDVDSLAGELLLSYQQYDEFSQRSEAIRAYIVCRFGVQAVVKSLLAHYSRVA